MENMSITEFNFHPWKISAESEIRFFTDLNKSGFRGRPENEMKPDEWFQALTKLRGSSTSNSCCGNFLHLALIYYFLRYQPGWRCR